MEKNKKQSGHKSFVKANVNIIAILLAFATLVVSIRLFDIQIINADKYKQAATYSQWTETPVPALRGTIYDADGTVLAQSAKAWKCYVIPEYFEGNDGFRQAVCRDLAETLDLDYEELMELTFVKANKNEDEIQYAQKRYIKYQMEYEEKCLIDCGDENDRYVIDSAGVKHKNPSPDCLCHKTYLASNGKSLKYSKVIKLEDDSKRYYPMDSLGSSFLGFVNGDGTGASGLERYYNTALSGVDGKVTSYGSNLDTDTETVYDATNGTSLVLTINETIQYSLKKNLEAVYESSGGIGAYGIVMDVKTGAVLGMETVGYKGGYNLNEPDELNAYYEKVSDRASSKDNFKYIEEIAKNSRVQDREKVLEDIAQINSAVSYEERAALHKKKLHYYFKLQQRNNYCVAEIYHPGSVFKIFVTAAVLEEDILEDDYTYCCNGYKDVEDRTFHCHNRNGHGYQSLRKGLMNSCNPFFITMGLKLGREKFFEYFDAFGFTEKTRFESFEESSPYYYDVDKLTNVNLASSSFGQAFSVTPIQMITAISAIANGGYLMQPYIVDKELDSDGNIIKQTQPVVRRQVVSKETASEVASMMEDVVKSGTGKNGYVAGYRVAGKTGTTQKYQEAGVYIASFGCFAPANDPEIAVLIIVDEPTSEINGSTVCAPVAAKVVEDALENLGVERQYTENELSKLDTTTPGVIGRNADEAENILSQAGFKVRTIGNGEKVISQSPAGGQTIPQNGVVAIYTTDDENEKVTVTVPNLAGMTGSQVKKLAASEGINVRLSGNTGSSDMVSYDQSIAAGSEAEYGTIVTVYLKSYTGVDDT